MNTKQISGVFTGERAVSSVVEHYLDTVAKKSTFAKSQSLNNESHPLCPDLCPDPGAQKPLGRRRFSRIGRGLYRYGPTAEIYNCRKVGGKNQWRKLNTTDRKAAVAIAALTSYSEAQNGDHRVAVIPDHLSRLPLTISGSEVQPIPVPPCPTETTPPSAMKAAPRSMSIRALVEELKAQWKHLAPSTQKIRETYLNVLSKHLDVNADMASLTPSMVRRVRGALTQGRKPTTVNDIMSKALRPLLTLAVEIGLLEKSPLDSIKSLKKERAIRLQPTWSQAETVIEEIERSAPNSALLLRFMLLFGAGQAEVKSVLGEHVDFERGAVHLFRGKTRKEYTVPIYSHAEGFIKNLKKSGRLAPGKHVFEWQNPRKALESACRKLKLPVYSPRALRRTFIIHCLERGVDPRVVASWQGHADARLILTTYGNFISADHAKNQAAKLI